LAGIALEKNGLACFQRGNRPTQVGFVEETTAEKPVLTA
jgi:hypothetical protein